LTLARPEASAATRPRPTAPVLRSGAMGQTDPRRSACSAAPPVRHMQTAGFAARTNLLSFERGASRPTGGQQSSTPAGMRGPPQSQVVPYVMQSAQSTVQKWRQWHIKWRLSVAMQQAVPPDEHTAMGEVHPQGQLALRGALANQPALSCQGRREGSASIHQQPDGCGCEPHSTRSADESDDASSDGGEVPCVVCFTDLNTHAPAPCGHQCACERCSLRMQQCPICRRGVVMWVRIHRL